MCAAPVSEGLLQGYIPRMSSGVGGDKSYRLGKSMRSGCYRGLSALAESIHDKSSI